jgi:hypothetical protein
VRPIGSHQLKRDTGAPAGARFASHTGCGFAKNVGACFANDASPISGLTIDRPKLSPEGIKRLQGTARAAGDGPSTDPESASAKNVQA